MIELQYITNEVTGERRLYFRHIIPYVDGSGAFSLLPEPQWSEWKRVPELTLDEASMNDLIESGGLFPEARGGSDDN